MNNIIRKNWRDSASLIVLTKRNSELVSRGGVNYEILLQTRTGRASFPNSVVFPGGVSEAADGSERWHQLLKSFGYTKHDFESLHTPSTVISPTFQNNPIQRHIALRITAIRETFEELGFLLCSREHKEQRQGFCADVLSDIDVDLWQKRLIKNPDTLWNLCEEHSCYPDIWSLHYWSNWLTPVHLPKRFNTAFFVTALEEKPGVRINSEVASVEWCNPTEVLNKTDVILYPPQTYELTRLSHVTDLGELIQFARHRSCYSNGFFFPVFLKTKDGILQILPGDELYPSSVDYRIDNNQLKYIDKTILELRESCQVIHRLEVSKTAEKVFVIKNFKPQNHINMGDLTFVIHSVQ